MSKFNLYKSTNHSSRQFGGALLSTIVGMGMVGIIAMMMSTFFKNQFQAIKVVESKGEIEDMRRYVRINFDCSRTFMGHSCVNGFNPRNKKGGILTTKAGSKKLGPYHYQSYCKVKAGKKEIDFSVIEKVKKKKVNLFKDVPYLCP